ncbi:hypothetical protein Y1Q_0013847 [Alligator mississippiensis]|uniref:Uncharacterized protein n=1 Tax=Alligator mississippiensis TaxID=8496 RepID=A0A151NFV6_ALLMI|nr:hypothetical protein Y1Q_0013847 [Alligator mississippiensis]
MEAPGLLGSCNTRTAYYEFPWPRPRSLASGTKKTLADMTREARTPSSIKKTPCKTERCSYPDVRSLQQSEEQNPDLLRPTIIHLSLLQLLWGEIQIRDQQM